MKSIWRWARAHALTVLVAVAVSSAVYAAIVGISATNERRLAATKVCHVIRDNDQALEDFLYKQIAQGPNAKNPKSALFLKELHVAYDENLVQCLKTV